MRLYTAEGVEAATARAEAEQGWAVQLDPGLTAVDPALAFRDFQRLNLKCDGPLSNVAFNCNLRHYATDLVNTIVGRCRFTPA